MTIRENSRKPSGDGKVRFAQIGCGYWGPNLLRNFSTLPNAEVVWLIDSSSDRRAFVAKSFPSVRTSANVADVLNDTTVDGIIIATPAKSHFDLALTALRAGKHVFVEKPLATSVAEVDALAREATRQNLVVMAGHTFLYNGAVRYVKNLIDRGDLGEVRYIYSQRLNLGRIRSDIDALWNFAPHDVSIIQYWLDDLPPERVHRAGMSYVQDNVDDVVFLNMTYPNRVMANIHVSWLDPQKVRKMVVVGSKKMVVYDDVSENKITILDKGIDRHARLGVGMDFDTPQHEMRYRDGDIHIPKVEFPEPLKVEAAHFAECILNGSVPITGVAHARTVIDILERAQNTRA